MSKKPISSWEYERLEKQRMAIGARRKVVVYLTDKQAVEYGITEVEPNAAGEQLADHLSRLRTGIIPVEE